MKILIADDHALFRDGLNMQLEQIAPEAVVFQASSYQQTLKILEEERIDLVILDLGMPDMDWEMGFIELQSKAKDARFVILSASEEVRDVKRSLELGACGYITKRMDPKILSSALKLVLDGGTYIPPSMIGNDKPTRKELVKDMSDVAGKAGRLTKRQTQVLELIALGKSNKQIAYEMDVSEATVKLHVNALLKALGSTNRTQAVITAQKMGLI